MALVEVLCQHAFMLVSFPSMLPMLPCISYSRGLGVCLMLAKYDRFYDSIGHL